MAQLGPLLDELDELLPQVCRWGCSEDTTDELCDLATRTYDWSKAATAVAYASEPAAGGQPTCPPSQRAHLSSCLAAAYEQLAAVKTPLPSGTQDELERLTHSNLVCLLWDGCLALAVTFGEESQASSCAQAAAAYLFRSGQRLLGWVERSLASQPAGAAAVVNSVAGGFENSAAELACLGLTGQTSVMLALFSVSMRQLSDAPRHLPATQFGAWLLASTKLLHQLASQHSGTVPYKHRLSQLTTMLAVAQKPEFSHLAEQLQQPQLSIMWAEQLLPAVASAAVGLGLPAERRPPMCDWGTLGACARVLSSSMLQPALQRLTDAAGHDSSGPEAATLARLLHSAVVLVQHSVDDAEAASSAYLYALLGTALLCQRQANQVAVDQQRRQRHAQQLQALLPKLAAAGAQLVRNGGGDSDAGQLCCAAGVQAMQFLGDILLQPPGQPAAIKTLGDIESWATAACAALRMFAAAAEALRHAEQLPPPSRQTLLRMANEALEFACDVGRRCSEPANQPQLWMADRDALEPAVRALWQLHSAASRIASSMGSSSRPPLPSVQQLDQLVVAVAAPALAAAVLVRLPRSAALEAGAPLPAPVRHMEAMAVSCVEALQGLYSAGAADALRSCGDPSNALLAAQGLGHAIECGAAGLVAKPGVQELSTTILCSMPQDPSLRGAVFMALSGAAAARSPQLATLLLSSEVLEEFGIQRALRAATENDVMVVCNVPLLLDSVLQEAGKELAAGERAGAGSSSGSGSGSGGSEEEQGRREQLQACVAALRRAMQPMWTSNVGGRTLRRFNEIQGHLPAALRLGTPLAAALLDWWRRPEAQQAAALELAQAAARRSCAYLRCGNLGGEGGPAAGEGVGSQRCSACRAVWYCGTACSHADWRVGHRRVCKALGAARAAEKERRRQQETEQGG